jgi:hypothetical protein
VETSPRAVFVGRDGSNTVSLVSASYVTIRDLLLDGRHADADAVKAEGSNDPVHHITLEGLTIVGYDRGQDIVGISTKCPAWAWTIRENVIVGVGTGMYLGNSDGRAPFIAGVIENNIIIDAIGYDIEIKYQTVRPALADLPSGASVTSLRGNVFAKSRNSSSGNAARPNVLLGSFPTSGGGRDDRYEFSHNIVFDNASEALFQGEGNLHLDRNVFLNRHGDAVVIRPHHDRRRRVTITNNFIAAAGRGIAIASGDSNANQTVVGNVLYVGISIAGIFARSNRVEAYPGPNEALRRWLEQHWTIQHLSERSFALERVCGGAAAGADMCRLLGTMR